MVRFVVAIVLVVCLFLLVASPASAAHFGYRPLARNMVGEDVEELQSMLRQMGYYKGAVNGKYTQQLETAVKAMQKVYGLPQTGKVEGKFLDIARTLWSIYVNAEFDVAEVAPEYLNRPTQKIQLHVYTVQKGDTLSAIARRFKVSMANIARLNRIVSPGRILAGQKLYVVTAR